MGQSGPRVTSSLKLNLSKCQKEGKKKGRTLYSLAFLRKYLIGVVFRKLCLLEVGGREGRLVVENTVTFIASFFRNVIFYS